MESITRFSSGQLRQRNNILADVDVDDLTEVDVAGLLDVPRRTVQGWRYKKIGPRYTKVGGKVRYSRADIISWLAAQRVEPR